MPTESKIALAVRVRNEWALLRGLLTNVASTCDEAWILDDASSEPCPSGLGELVERLTVLRAPRWSGLEKGYREGLQRDFLIQAIKRRSECQWVLQLDADERLAEPSALLPLVRVPDATAWLLPLVDFYITPLDAEFVDGVAPEAVRDWFGVETRWTLALFRPLPTVYVSRGDVREPQGFAPSGVREATQPMIEHYGKAVSVGEWERKASFYAERYPAYRAKWLERRGKAVHDGESDFGTRLVHRSEAFDPRAAPVVHRYAIEQGWRPTVKSIVLGRLGASRHGRVAR
jgi:hypothetical protein